MPDSTPPIVLTFNPADEATSVTIGSNIVVTFNENIQRGFGDILLKTAAGITVETYKAETSNVVISGTALTIKPTINLNYKSGYKIEFAAGSVQDTSGNNYIGTSAYNFTTFNPKYIETFIGTYRALVGHNTPWAAYGTVAPTSIIDVDGDGYSEIIFSGRQAALGFPQNFALWSDSPIFIYKNINGKWIDSTVNLIPEALSRQVRGVEAIPLVADFNKDGLMDFIVGGGTDMPYYASNYFYINKGGFFERQEIGTAGWTHGVDMGDINGDGYIDVIMTGYGAPPLKIGLGGPSGFNFYKVFNSKVGLESGGSDVTIGDFLGDSDGKLEIIISDSDVVDPVTGADISLYKWRITSSDTITFDYVNLLPEPYFHGHPLTGFKGSHDARTHPLDINNDGLMDLMALSIPGMREIGFSGGYTPTSAVQFFQNMGGGLFKDVTDTYLINYNNTSQLDYDPDFIDINGDGLIDIFMSSSGVKANSTAILLKTKDGPYKEINRDFFAQLEIDAFLRFKNDSSKLTSPYVLTNEALATSLKNPMMSYALLGEIANDEFGFGECKLIKISNNIFSLIGTFNYDLPEVNNSHQYKLVWQTKLRFDIDGKPTVVSTGFWKDEAIEPSSLKKSDAVNLTDAIAILKMIVGLNVNSNNTALSPYQAIAADFDQSGDVGLTDAIGVLKMVVGLSAPTPTWKYYDDTKLNSTYTSAQSLNPKGWTTSALISDTGAADSSVKLVGVLTGDVDGSWTGV